MSEDPPISAPASSPEGERRARASELLEEFLAHEHGERIALGDLVRILGDRAFGAMILLLAIPNVLPVPGLSTVTGLPIVLIAAQLMFGRAQPWLPRRLAAASMEREGFLNVLRRAHPRMQWIEGRLLRARLPALTSPVAERFIGAAMVVLAGVLALPIVFGNQPPAFALALMALGLIEKDGAFIVAGLVAGLVALAIVAAVVFGFAQGLLMLVGLATA
ncbi:exopolysaccharide biosynthesis protein [Azospirillum sp. TSO22-1]|uniref:exopolysaccharide biosynthesis protein n=1 Tax=Azospirillum sp. TSO22-1 TaxID=716789 RepID=UPI000D61C4C1|nr:exopolysaccharide biosynthesis protein [Azospirillum sp. TSO22-1]PWC38625.1 exopolysaccharide biosynthesis protein [Azospirillum sp. TSO22-1]